jgi:hypothetical protein
MTDWCGRREYRQHGACGSDRTGGVISDPGTAGVLIGGGFEVNKASAAWRAPNDLLAIIAMRLSLLLWANQICSEMVTQFAISAGESVISARTWGAGS